MLLHIATTRFNNDTWNQNCMWRERNEWKGCVYGTPMKMKDNIIIGGLVVILEMNNEKNIIEGMGLVKNTLSLDRSYNIYNWGNYNRYTYSSKYRINRDELNHDETITLSVLEMLLFKGSRHLKRGQGITSLPEWIMKNNQIDFQKKIKEMFVSRFK